MNGPTVQQMYKQGEYQSCVIATSLALKSEEKPSVSDIAAMAQCSAMLSRRVIGNRVSQPMSWADARLMWASQLRFALDIVELGLEEAIKKNG